MKERKLFWDKLFQPSDVDYLNLYQKVYNESIEEAISKMNTSENSSGYSFFLKNRKYNWSSDKIEQYIKKKYMFFGFYVTYISYAERDIYEDTKEIMVFCDGFRNSLYNNLYQRLVNQSILVLIKELGIQKQLKKLPEIDSTEQYYYFEYNILQSEEFLSYLCSSYPEMFNVLERTTKQYCSFVKKIIKSICLNRKEIREELGLEREFSYIKQIYCGQGDYHNGGKSVCQIVLDTEERVIYKPRNLEADGGFQKLVCLLNKSIDDKDYLKLKTTKQYMGNDYGVVEFVSHFYCDTSEELERYYYKVGELLAILYLIDASDMHRENLIACGEDPVLVDGETLFSPYNCASKTKNNENDNDLYMKISTIQRIGILPFIIRGKNNSVSYGAINNSKGEKAPFKTIKIINVNTSEVKAVYEYEILSEEKNNPTNQDNALDESLICQNIIRGFMCVGNWTLTHKEKISGFINKCFNDIKVRVLIKNTMLYDSILQMSYHPDVLSDSITRRVIILRNFIESEVDEEVAVAECRQIEQGDIPIFWTRYDDCDLHWQNNKIESVFLSSAKKRFESKIKLLSKELLDLQKYIIKENLTVINERYAADMSELSYRVLQEELLPNHREDMVEWLKEVTEYLSKKSVEFGEGCRTWIERGFDERSNQFSQVNKLDNTLYMGQAGMALYYMGMYEVIPDFRYLDFAEQIVKSMVLEIDEMNKDDDYNIGTFTGLSGRVYILSKILEKTRKALYASAIDKCLMLMKDMIAKDTSYDIISGTAGYLMVLLSIKERSLELIDEVLVEECIGKCVEHLKCEKRMVDGLVTWIQNIEDEEKNYTGFGHGTMGILTALARYYKIYRDETVIEDIKSSLEWMDTMFLKEESNWYRDSKKKEIALGWCHGASGILLGYSLIKEYCPQVSGIEKYMKAARNVVIDKGLGNNATLCHGDLGNLEILYIYGKLCGDLECIQLYEKGIVWEFYNVILKRWKGQCFRGREIFGMMIGLTGFGYAITRYLKQESVSAVLFIE